MAKNNRKAAEKSQSPVAPTAEELDEQLDSGAGNETPPAGDDAPEQEGPEEEESSEGPPAPDLSNEFGGGGDSGPPESAPPETPPAGATPEEESPPADAWQPPTPPDVHTIRVAFPVLVPQDYPAGGAQAQRRQHFDLQLSPRQAESVRQVFAGLRERPHLVQENGRPIVTQVDALRWILEQISTQLPECELLPPTGATD